MLSYELVYIVNPNITEEELPSILDKVGDTIKKLGGNVTEVNKWGKKKLAYPIKKFTEGNYVLTKFDIEPSSVKKIDSSLKMYDEIIRHLIIKTAK